MRCPKCDQKQPDRATECVRCGLIFTKFRGDDDWAAGDRPGPAHSRASRPSHRPLLRVIRRVAMLLVASAGWFWFMFWSPGGLPVDGRAYRDPDHGFALVVPQGWTSRKAGTCEDTPTDVSPAPPCPVLELTRRRFARATMQVAIAPARSVFKTGWGGSGTISEGSKNEIARTFTEGTARAMPGYTSEICDTRVVDGITALHVRGAVTVKASPLKVGNGTAAGRTQVASLPQRHQEVGNVLVPAGSRAFLISYRCEAEACESLGRTFDAVVASFRVTGGRSTSFQRAGGVNGSIKGDAILAVLIGVTIAAFKY